MSEKQIEEKTRETVYCLYQNRECEALELVSQLLPMYQQRMQKLLEEGKSEQALRCLNMLKQLIECYHAQDMLGMADCLCGKGNDLLWR